MTTTAAKAATLFYEAIISLALARLAARPAEAMPSNERSDERSESPSHNVLRMACERRTCGVHDRVLGQRGALGTAWRSRAEGTLDEETSHLFKCFNVF